MSQKLSWQEIRTQYPDTFVLIDQCEEQQLSPDHVEIVGGEVVWSTPDGQAVFEEYRRRGKPSRMSFGHTSWPRFEVEESPAPGLRFSNV